jgi:hypothetical protein
VGILASLKISRVVKKEPTPRDLTKTQTTKEYITYSMTTVVAKAMCQCFIDGCLIKSAVDTTPFLFKDAWIYQLTPKGLHIIHRFISKNNINADHLRALFRSLPVCTNLLHLERQDEDDQMVLSEDVITDVFRLFAGNKPRHTNPVADKDLDPVQRHNKRTKGIPFFGVKSKGVVYDLCFTAMDALAWLGEFTSVVGREEAASLAAYFVGFGWITLVDDSRKSNESAIVFTVENRLLPKVQSTAETDVRFSPFLRLSFIELMS